jgi:hypothetical protein
MSTQHTPTFRVTYRDGWEKLHTFDVHAANLDAATDAAVEWQGNAPIAIVSVVEVFRDSGITYCSACGSELETHPDDAETHPDDADDFVEFPAGEFPGEAEKRAYAALNAIANPGCFISIGLAQQIARAALAKAGAA